VTIGREIRGRARAIGGAEGASGKGGRKTSHRGPALRDRAKPTSLKIQAVYAACRHFGLILRGKRVEFARGGARGRPESGPTCQGYGAFHPGGRILQCAIALGILKRHTRYGELILRAYCESHP